MATIIEVKHGDSFWGKTWRRSSWQKMANIIVDFQNTAKIDVKTNEDMKGLFWYRVSSTLSRNDTAGIVKIHQNVEFCCSFKVCNVLSLLKGVFGLKGGENHQKTTFSVYLKMPIKHGFWAIFEYWNHFWAITTLWNGGYSTSTFFWDVSWMFLGKITHPLTDVGQWPVGHRTFWSRLSLDGSCIEPLSWAPFDFNIHL